MAIEVYDNIRSVSEFMAHLPEKEFSILKRVYRGHINFAWKLVPGLFRITEIPTGAGYEGFEFALLEQFQKQSMPFLRSSPTDLLEWIALVQHHGLPTRLLDWTESPLNALLFAVDDPDSKYKNSDGIIWQLAAFNARFPAFYSLDELDEALSKRQNNIYYPYHTSARMTGQKGCFSLHPSPYYGSDPKPFVPLEERAENGDTSLALTKYVIPANSKEEIRYELHKLGIDYFVLFPDLEGLCRKLKWDYERDRGLKTTPESAAQAKLRAKTKHRESGNS